MVIRLLLLLLMLLAIALSTDFPESVSPQEPHYTDGQHNDNYIHSEEDADYVQITENSQKILRSVSQVVTAVEQEEGDGARVKRVIGNRQLYDLDPFLMMDEFFVSKPAGFPDHPHRGFETVTYMLEGRFAHKDNHGHFGIIGPGDVQWMTAGRGIVHSEMPEAEGVNHGLQLWVNLKAKDKMIDPNYQELLARDIPKVTADGLTVAVIAGESYGKSSAVYTRTPCLYLHVTLEGEKTFQQDIPKGWTAFIYVLKGKIDIVAEQTTEPAIKSQILVLSDGDKVEVRARKLKKATASEFVLIAGEPIKEPVAKHGPFVMNTQAEIQQAINDYRNGKF